MHLLKTICDSEIPAILNKRMHTLSIYLQLFHSLYFINWSRQY